MTQVGSKKAPIQWVDNIKLLAMWGILSFHFWIFFYKRDTDPLYFVSSFYAFLSLPFQMGWQGNELFFAMSGLGLTLSYIKKQPNFLQFLIARAWRIYLPYWVTVLLVFMYGAVMHWAGSWDVPYYIPKDAREWIANIFLLNLNGITYFSSHHWFLFTLFALYVLYPFFFFICRHCKGSTILIMLAIQFVAVKGGIKLGLFSAVSSLTYWMGSFCVGALLAIQLYEDPERLERFLMKAFPVGLALWTVCTAFVFDRRISFMLDPFLCFSVIVCLYQIARLPWSFPRLNKITFEIYLVHMPFVGFYRHLFGFVDQPKWAIYLFYIISSIAMGWLVHQVTRLLGKGFDKMWVGVSDSYKELT